MASDSERPYKETLRAVVTIAHKPRDILELEIKKGQRLLLLEPKGEWWYIARVPNGKVGWVPTKHLRILKPIERVNLPELFINWWEKKEAAVGNNNLAIPTSPKDRGKDKDTPPCHKKLMKDTFPFPPADISFCNLVGCKVRKMEKGLGACAHDMERFLRAGLGENIYCAKWLRRESLNWHPDRIGKRCEQGWKREGEHIAGEMFVILTDLIDKQREREGGKEA